MNLIRHRVYINNISYLKFVVHNVYHQTDTYVKCRGSLINKRNGILYETKNHKLDKKLIKDWRNE